ncbi:hypothetical protein [Amycolatopsis vastitatis]|uniref:Uncharacterized protein n=1 Tax=Amycolatopsis vastitatis TaxID=1905142 RepID=A0A229TET2_9PSEU|nr:hypothetical protein [Amycolatopsis vastitatis]OXM69765.1 hypothetical protein CF165_09695 [Amycolatopsis vastitatis]
MTPLTDDYPVLLGPVRLETRFTETDLLVRVFPDEWAIDKFEPDPTEAEAGALKAYWTAFWRAGGRPAGEQAAWQELVARVPAGRAGWLLQQYKPANPADKPSAADAKTAVLVIVSEQVLSANDRQPTITYWTAVWRAHGDRGKLRDADIALLAAVGASRAPAIRARPPSGVDGAPADPGNDVVLAFQVLPRPPRVAARSWTQAAKARLLPDRFVAYGFVGGAQVFSVSGAAIPAELTVSPDPGLPPEEQLKVNEQTGELRVPDGLRWLTDFGRAVDVGMGLRIPRAGFGAKLDRLVVLGLRAQAAPEQTAADLADLLGRQLRSPAGFALLPQGTPTNNTGAAPAGQDAGEEAEAARRATAARPAAAAPADWTAKTDGQWFAELLGLDPASLTGVPNADHTDQRDARAANTALWPATWGNYLRTTLSPIASPGSPPPPPILSEATIARTREFFLRHVSGRGPVPAVKIGRQPYGILPTTAFSRMTWPDSATAAHRRGLHRLLGAAAADWQTAAGKVTHLGGDHDDAHQALLDILALHPTTAEYHQRYAQSVEDIFNRENLGAAGETVMSALDRLRMAEPIRALLTRLGHADPPGPDPDLIRRLFAGTQYPLLAPLVDDRPLSETDPVRDYTPPPQARNYLRWLADHAGRDLDTIRLELGFTEDRPPAALLYLYLRHAVLLGWVEAGRRLAMATPGAAVPSAADPLFVHIRTRREQETADPPSESRYRQLYAPAPLITGDPARLLADFLPDVLGEHAATAELAEQVEAIGLLANLPTARLERVFAEHLDCAGYRLDAWRLGLANERLAELRYGPDLTAAPKRGVHLGAYGWLEHLEPRKPLGHKDVPADLVPVFGAATLPHDPGNGGYVHTPSPAQARTAAVLRAGYVANAGRTDPGSFAVNLSSERVRMALALLDGLRQGQSLSALLGYRFERGLHEGHPGVELDKYLQPLRAAFPLRAGKLSGEITSADDVKLVEARNVVDGLALVRRATRENHPTYPFGSDLLPTKGVTDDEKQAMNDEVRRLLNLHDALADLAVAEGAHQALLGNAERAAATLDAYAKEGFPPPPAVIDTPRSGITLTHRLGLQFTPGLDPDHGALLGHNGPRAQAEPAVNDWLPAVLPPASDVAARVDWTDPVTGKARSRVVTQQDTGLQPIDLLQALRTPGEGELAELDDRIAGVVFGAEQPRPDVLLKIRYTQRVPGKTTFFELSPLVATLRSLLTTSRPLRPSDLVPAAGAAPADRTADQAVSLPRERPDAVRASLDRLGQAVSGYLGDLSPLYPADPGLPHRAELLGGIDTFLVRYAELAGTAARFGIVRSGWGELMLWRRSVFTDVLAAVAETAARMGKSLADADALIAQYDKLPPSTSDDARFRLLQQAERLLTTKPTSPRPAKPAQLRTIVGNRRRDFDQRLQGLQREAKTTKTTLSGLLAEVSALLPLTGFDATGLDLTPFGDRVVTFGRDLLTRAQALRAEVASRLTAADEALVGLGKAVTGPDRVQAALDTLEALLGEDVLAVPEFTPPPQLAQDWHDARGDSDQLVGHLTKAPSNRDFPVDDWLHGIARVREKPRLWEKTVLLSDALLGTGGLLGTGLLGWAEPALVPIQLPYHRGDHWLGMEFAPGTEITEDKVLFTAHYAKEPVLGGTTHCGLLLDEWTEVIPAATETTGIAVHFDRPDSEPPQAMLLVTPPARTGHWDTGDLVAAITETFEAAKARAVEPEHLDDTAYAQLLPATVLSATQQPVTVSTDLAVANLRWKAAHE